MTDRETDRCECAECLESLEMCFDCVDTREMLRAPEANPSVGSKPSNPKQAFGDSKLPLHLWPTTATALGSLAFMEGALKYGRLNWRGAGVRASTYISAAKRHLDAWSEGEDNAPDSGLPHLASVLACVAILVDSIATGELNDDRHYHGEGYRKFVEELTPHVARLRELHKDKNPKHYTLADNSCVPTPSGPLPKKPSSASP